mgnify:CR=1 FL=1
MIQKSNDKKQSFARSHLHVVCTHCLWNSFREWAKYVMKWQLMYYLLIKRLIRLNTIKIEGPYTNSLKLEHIFDKLSFLNCRGVLHVSGGCQCYSSWQPKGNKTYRQSSPWQTAGELNETQTKLQLYVQTIVILSYINSEVPQLRYGDTLLESNGEHLKCILFK